MNTMPTTPPTGTESPATMMDTGMVMQSDDSSDSSSSSGSKSAQLNLPGFGNIDLSAFRVPGLSAPSLPNLTLPAIPTLPSLPKLFSEVPCISAVSGRPGSCRKADACTASHGLPDGPCALSLGVCCTAPFTCGQTVIGNETIITSPGFPEHTTKSDVCEVSIFKQLGVAQVRLDLEVFDIAGADSSGVCSEDVMEVTGGNADSAVPKICGMNQGQHLYIPVEKTLALTPLVIKFSFSKTSTAHRIFKIRVTQLKKDHPDLAPVGCVQYYNGKEGVVRSFNYEHVKNVGIRTIKGLKYRVCFKKSDKDHCKVKLQPTYTRVSRSAPYAYYPATNHHQRSYNNYVYPQRMYLNRPVLPVMPGYHSYPKYYRPVYHQARPVYYPMAPVNSYYYYPTEKTEKKVEVVDKKKELKEELDGLLAKKKLLIEELATLLKLPAVAELPKLPTFAPLPTLPSVSLPSLPTLTIPKIPTIEELLAKKVEKVEELKEIKKEDPYKQKPYQPAPAHLYKPEVGENKYEDPYKKPSVDIKKVIEEKKETVNEILTSLANGKIPSLISPLPTFPSMISKDAYGVIVDNDHEELGRGFSMVYKEECVE
jgi:hypothetical protein